MSGLYGIDDAFLSLAQDAALKAGPEWERAEDTRRHNYLKVLKAFQAAGVGDHHFAGTTGYGYGDLGREALESVYAEVFGTEGAIVRHQISSGTQAVSACLFGILLPGDELVVATGPPYDTVARVIGRSPGDVGSLREIGVRVKEVPLLPGGTPDLEAIEGAVGANTRAVLIQRSMGYSWRRALPVDEVGWIVEAVRRANDGAIIVVDNCYGEFVEKEEPGERGCDLVCGSLIKNPGGGIAPCGGYIAGKREYLDRVAARLTAPGQGAGIGPTLGLNRLLFQGFFMAPFVVSEAIKGAIFASWFLETLGFDTMPRPGDRRADSVQGILLGRPERLISFCHGIQAASPVNSMVLPEAGEMPGYGDKIVMGGGTFIQGASSELSVDAPLREPYACYLQGGVAWEQVALGVIMGVDRMRKDGLI
ncbi:MAG TPA: hypothetical protein GX506_07785 [Firmicutes bacterium]|nr:hypothetical protein [Bacillota bacterium]